MLSWLSSVPAPYHVERRERERQEIQDGDALSSTFGRSRHVVIVLNYVYQEEGARGSDCVSGMAPERQDQCLPQHLWPGKSTQYRG